VPLTSAARWQLIAYAYGLLVVVGMGYFLLGIPVQLTDSYGNIVKVSHGSFGSLVYGEFYQRSYLRPLLFAQLRVVYDLSGGHYSEWFRAWHVGQVLVLVVLFLRILNPRTAAGAAVVPIGLAMLIGGHTFAGTVREAFPINTFMTIVLCCYAGLDLALGPPRWWRDVAAALLFVSAALTVESGLLMAVIFVAAYAAGARGVSRAGVATIVLLVAGYLYLRFGWLHVGSPALIERSSGFGFGTLEPDALIAKFGERPYLFYAYNVMSSVLTVLLGEPRGGVWELTRALVRDQRAGPGLITMVACTMATGVIAAYVWSRRAEWRARRFDRSDQIVIVFAAMLIANAVVSYPYTKDVIMSPAGSLFALALAVSARHFIPRCVRLQPDRAVGWRLPVAAVAFTVLAVTWSYRALDAYLGLRNAGAKARTEWVYADQWFEREGQTLEEPGALALKNQLQTDAILRSPAPPALTGDWLEWFEQ
jgi:hypothetical protein